METQTPQVAGQAGAPPPAPLDPPFPYPDVDLIETDGVPLETDWHRIEMNLLIDLVQYHLRGREDFFVGGNMFIYFSEVQARNRDYRGPDFFFVKDVPFKPLRPYWAIWKEGGRSPDVIIELSSPTTKKEDLTTKKDIYARIFHTAEYYCYDPDDLSLQGWRIDDEGKYRPITPNDRGWLWSKQLGLWVGKWHGVHFARETNWLRFYDDAESLIPTEAEAERQRAEAQQHRAEAAEAELARLKGPAK